MVYWNCIATRVILYYLRYYTYLATYTNSDVTTHVPRYYTYITAYSNSDFTTHVTTRALLHTQVVDGVLELHGDNAGLVYFALKLLNRFADAATIPVAARILAPPVTNGFSSNIYIYIYIYISLSPVIYIYICICIYVYVYIYNAIPVVARILAAPVTSGFCSNT
jgi:hypothetical protein